MIACARGNGDVVTTLLAANAKVNQACNDGGAPLIVACEKGHTEVVTTLLAANAEVDQANNAGVTPMAFACAGGHLSVVQLLSSYGARRTFPFEAPHDTAEHVATRRRHHDIVAWLRKSRRWSTALHHLEILSRKRAVALLRAHADVNATSGTGLSPLDRAKFLCSMGEANAGSPPHAVLEAGAPWSRETNRFYPPKVRERVQELMLVWQWLKRRDQPYITIPFEVWEAKIVEAAVASDMWG